MDIHGHPCLCVVVEVDVEVDVGGLHMSEHPIQSGPYGAPSQNHWPGKNAGCSCTDLPTRLDKLTNPSVCIHKCIQCSLLRYLYLVFLRPLYHTFQLSFAGPC
jgi:hypothetical protein